MPYGTNCSRNLKKINNCTRINTYPSGHIKGTIEQLLCIHFIFMKGSHCPPPAPLARLVAPPPSVAALTTWILCLVFLRLVSDWAPFCSPGGVCLGPQSWLLSSFAPPLSSEPGLPGVSVNLTRALGENNLHKLSHCFPCRSVTHFYTINVSLFYSI